MGADDLEDAIQGSLEVANKCETTDSISKVIAIVVRNQFLVGSSGKFLKKGLDSQKFTGSHPNPIKIQDLKKRVALYF